MGNGLGTAVAHQSFASGPYTIFNWLVTSGYICFLNIAYGCLQGPNFDKENCINGKLRLIIFI